MEMAIRPKVHVCFIIVPSDSTVIRSARSAGYAGLYTDRTDPSAFGVFLLAIWSVRRSVGVSRVKRRERPPGTISRSGAILPHRRTWGNRASGRTPSVKSDHRVDDGKGKRGENQTAFLTRPDRRQRVHTRIRKADPFTSAFTRCKLGLKTRFVLLFAWLTLLPV